MQAAIPVASRRFDDLIKGLRDFGKVSGHPARLNFGDCFAYALERVGFARDDQLLTKHRIV